MVNLFGLDFSAGQISLVVGGVVTIIGAIVTGVISVINALRVTREKVEQVASSSAISGEKLNRIEVLVDGRYSQVLQELANVKLLLANATGLTLDADRAKIAQRTADEQAKRVDDAGPVIK